MRINDVNLGGGLFRLDVEKNRFENNPPTHVMDNIMRDVVSRMNSDKHECTCGCCNNRSKRDDVRGMMKLIHEIFDEQPMLDRGVDFDDTTFIECDSFDEALDVIRQIFGFEEPKKVNSWNRPTFTQTCTCVDNPWTPRMSHEEMLDKSYHETNEGCPIFGRHNDWGEPTPIRRRSFDELERHDSFKRRNGVEGIRCDVKVPQRHMFRTREGFASASDKFAQLEDLLHSINW